MPTKRQLGLAVATLLIGLAAINFGVVYLTRNSVPRRVMRHARDSQGASVLALGNSLVAAGFAESAFDAAAGLTPPQGAVNLGLGASTPVEQLLLFRYGLSHAMRPRLVIYGFYDLQLTEPNRFSAGEMIGNHAMLYYVEPFYARRFYTLPVRDSLQFRAVHEVPMFAERGAVWAKVEIVRRAMAQQGMPAQRSNQFGRASDFSLLEAASAESFRRDCEAAFPLPLAPPVRELFQQARDAGVTIAVVEMPMRQAHRGLFYETPWWRQYIAHVTGLMSVYDVKFVDASDWIAQDGLFDDPLHLSERGAAMFSERLGRLLGPKLAYPSSKERLMPSALRGEAKPF